MQRAHPSTPRALVGRTRRRPTRRGVGSAKAEAYVVAGAVWFSSSAPLRRAKAPGCDIPCRVRHLGDDLSDYGCVTVSLGKIGRPGDVSSASTNVHAPRVCHGRLKQSLRVLHLVLFRFRPRLSLRSAASTRIPSDLIRVHPRLFVVYKPCTED